jgi:hypothetical protein
MGFIIALISLMVLIEIAIWVSMYLAIGWQRKHIVEPIKKIMNDIEEMNKEQKEDIKYIIDDLSSFIPKRKREDK